MLMSQETFPLICLNLQNPRNNIQLIRAILYGNIRAMNIRVDIRAITIRIIPLSNIRP